MAMDTSNHVGCPAVYVQCLGKHLGEPIVRVEGSSAIEAVLQPVPADLDGVEVWGARGVVHQLPRVCGRPVSLGENSLSMRVLPGVVDEQVHLGGRSGAHRLACKGIQFRHHLHDGAAPCERWYQLLKTHSHDCAHATIFCL